MRGLVRSATEAGQSGSGPDSRHGGVLDVGWLRRQRRVSGLTYRSHEWFDDWIGAHTWRASASFVTGARNMKAGYQGAFYVDDELHGGNTFDLSYRAQNGVPDQLTEDLF